MTRTSDVRRVLMVAYFFPPVGGGGVARTLAHARYLRTTGWEPVVLTTRNAAYRVLDPNSLTQIPPGVLVERTTIVEPAHARHVARRVLGVWRSIGPGLRTEAVPVADEARRSPAASSAPAASAGSRPPQLGTIHRALNTAWSGFVRFAFFPDEQVLWAPSAVRRGSQLHHRRPLRAIYSTSGPVTSHLIAGLLQPRTGVPWIADFRDPWIGNAYEQTPPRPHPQLRRRLERWIVERADRVVFATPSLQAVYARRYPEHAWRFRTIPNGYDADSPTPPPAPSRSESSGPDDRFELVYAGSLYGETELDIFLDGLARFRRRDLPGAQALRVTFLGWMTDHNRAVGARWAPELGGAVRFDGVVPKDEAHRRVADASAALHLAAGGLGREMFVGGKLYEYLGLNRPVMAMVPPGDARSVLEELNWGVVVDPDPESVAVGLERLMNGDYRTGIADPEGRYDRRRLTEMLADLLDEVTAAR